MVHVSSTMWRTKNQPSNSISCDDNALHLLVLVAGILYREIQVTSPFSIWSCVLNGCFERKKFLNGQIAFEEHWRLQSWTLDPTLHQCSIHLGSVSLWGNHPVSHRSTGRLVGRLNNGRAKQNLGGENKLTGHRALYIYIYIDAHEPKAKQSGPAPSHSLTCLLGRLPKDLVTYTVMNLQHRPWDPDIPHAWAQWRRKGDDHIKQEAYPLTTNVRKREFRGIIGQSPSVSKSNWDMGEPTHTLGPCWMSKPLPPRNQCTGWFAPVVQLVIWCDLPALSY